MIEAPGRRTRFEAALPFAGRPIEARPANARLETDARLADARVAGARLETDARVAGARVAGARPIAPFSHYATSMGGRLAIHLDVENIAAAAAGTAVDPAGAEAAAHAAVARIERWAARLTRHSDASELSALNADPRSEVAVGPTLAAALRAGRMAAEQTGGLADITLLGARLAAEGLQPADGLHAAGGPREGEGFVSHAFGWSLAPAARSAVVRRDPEIRFDLGGIGKGWIADRALRLLDAWPGAIVDADGDLAIRCAPGRVWEIAVDDPRRPDTLLAVFRLGAGDGLPGHWGVATSGTSVHRWSVAGKPSHHLIDPRTGRPAVTDVVQATVVAGSALRAEILAKAAVIAGSVQGFALLDRAGVRGAVLLTEHGETLALPQTLSLLSA